MARYELPPNQVVEALRIRVHPREQTAPQSHIRGPNGLMRFLRAFSRPITNRAVGEIFGSELLFYQVPACTHCLITQVSRVGSHVGDVSRLVQTLRERHRFLDAKAHSRTGSLL